jgi:hypothetical protein
VNGIGSSWLAAARTQAQRAYRGQPAPDEYGKSIFLHRCNYVAALKIVLLECSGGEPEEKLLDWFEWMHAEFVWAGVATAFAARYFARNARTPNWLNGIRSVNRTRAIDRARNIAWDLTFVALWVRKLRQAKESGENVLWMLCSLDHAVREVARLYLLPEAPDEDTGEGFRRRLAEWYGPAAGGALAARYSELVLGSSSAGRRAPDLLSDMGLDSMIAELEAAVRRPLSGR